MGRSFSIKSTTSPDHCWQLATWPFFNIGIQRQHSVTCTTSTSIPNKDPPLDTMNTLDQLPSEILIAVAQTIHDTLPALALVCKRFYLIFNPTVYRFVHFVGPRNYYKRGKMELPNWRSKYHHINSNISNVARQDTRIKDFEAFFRQMTTNKRLRSLVHGMSLDWSRHCEMAYGWYTINSMETSLQYLHLKPGFPQTPDSMPLGLTSLAIDAAFLDLNYPVVDEVQWTTGVVPMWRVDRDVFYQFFCLPNLKSLSIDSIRGWDWFLGEPSRFADKMHTSNITSLKFGNSAPAGSDLAELLSWPKDLQSYHHEVMPHYLGYSCGHKYVDQSHGPDFIQALGTQQANLQEVFIDSRLDRGPESVMGLMDMTSFTNLRRLGLKLEDLDWPKLQQKELPFSSPISSRLPYKLEELQIQVGVEDDFSQYFEISTTQGGVSKTTSRWYEVGDLVTWLCEIAESKKSRYPNLRRITMWMGKGCPPAAFWRDMTRRLNYHQVEEAFREAHIMIDWVECEHSPMFNI